MQGKYFILVSQHCSLAVGTGRKDGTGKPLAVMCNPNKDQKDQIWYEEESSGTIRSKADDNLCLTVVGDLKSGDNLFYLKEYEPSNTQQHWKVDGTVVRHRNAKDMVLDIKDEKSDCGAVLCSWPLKGSRNQLWNVQYLPPVYFYILSENGLAVDVEHGNAKEGARVILWEKKPKGQNNNQLWYEDTKGCLRSKLNDFAFEAPINKGLTMHPLKDEKHRSWLIYGPTIFRKTDIEVVLDAAGKSSGSEVIVTKRPGNVEKWHQDYNV